MGQTRFSYRQLSPNYQQFGGVTKKNPATPCIDHIKAALIQPTNRRRSPFIREPTTILCYQIKKKSSEQKRK